MQKLKGSLGQVFGKMFRERGINVSRRRAMTFDEVRVIAVHRTHQAGDGFARDRVQRSAQPFRTADERHCQTRQLRFRFGQERLHVRGVVKKHLAG